MQPKQIRSQNQLTLGQLIDKPPLATVIYDANGIGMALTYLAHHE